MPRRGPPWRYLRRSGLFPWHVIVVPWGRYVRAQYLFWRIRIPLWLALAMTGWVLFDAVGLVGGVLVAYLAEAAFSYRRPASRGPDHPSAAGLAATLAEALQVERRWRTEAAPSPAGWQPPAGCRPGWDWTPPDGLRPRLDRVPVWVRMWHRAPFVDRYAHTWMWTHGGWDTLPPPAGAR